MGSKQQLGDGLTDQLDLSNQMFLQQTNYLSDEAFLQVVYVNYLRRPPDLEGKAFYLKWLREGHTRQDLLAAIRSSREFRSIAFDYFQYPPRLNLGCGFDIKSGYLNVDFQDFHNPDLVADIRSLTMLPSDFYEEIIAQDCLEHLPRCDTVPTLKEWFRLLKAEGVLRLRVPNLIGLLRLLESANLVEAQERLIQNLFGTQSYTGDWHFVGFTQLLLNHYLKEVGFSEVFFEVQDQWLFNVTARKR
jgi:predicted SAM-dependent methyltransferase